LHRGTNVRCYQSDHNIRCQQANSSVQKIQNQLLPPRTMACPSIRDQNQQVRGARSVAKSKDKLQEMGEAGGRGWLTRLSGGGGRRGAPTGSRPIVSHLSGWRRKRMRGNPLDSPRRPRAPPPKPAKSDAWGEKGSLSSLLPPRWVRIGGRQRKEGGEMMRKEGGRPGRGGAGRASESVVAGGGAAGRGRDRDDAEKSVVCRENYKGRFVRRASRPIIRTGGSTTSVP
jgi:hypothetical protein